MGRKKVKSSEKVAALRAYVKKKHHQRVMEAIKREVNQIKLEELTEKPS